jgi:hypothetical protein
VRLSSFIFSPDLRDGIDAEAKGTKKPPVLPMVFHSPNTLEKFSLVPFATPPEETYLLGQTPHLSKNAALV